MTQPEMLGHVFLHTSRVEGVCTTRMWLIAGGHEGRESRHTVFFTPLNHGYRRR